MRLSKLLSRILRHRATEMGLRMRSDGYCLLSDVLALSAVSRLGATEEAVEAVVRDNDKSRFSLIEEDGVRYIRANQGHSLKCVDEEKLLTAIESADEIPVVVHGTNTKAWPLIQKTGLNKMARTHIHCASGLLGEEGVVSGMRRSCRYAIYIDAAKAMADGIRFFKSDNGVILTSGIGGVLDPKYFSKVVDLKLKTEVPIASGTDAVTSETTAGAGVGTGAGASTDDATPSATSETAEKKKRRRGKKLQ